MIRLGLNSEDRGLECYVEQYPFLIYMLKPCFIVHTDFPSNISKNHHRSSFRILSFLDPLQSFLPAFKAYMSRGFRMNFREGFLPLGF